MFEGLRVTAALGFLVIFLRVDLQVETALAY